MKRFLSIPFFILNFSLAPAMTHERGFIHPGGLHTQADFDRVKAHGGNGEKYLNAARGAAETAAFTPGNHLIQEASTGRLPTGHKIG